MIQGSPKFDGIAVAKIEIDFLKNPVHIEVQAAFINTKTGDTHGWTRGGNVFSDRTRTLLLQLRDSMEQDLADRHFSTGGSSLNTSGPPRAEHVGGISEFLGTTTEDGAHSI